MCVIFFYANAHPGENEYKLILASNRDEYYDRETCSAILWANPNQVYGGVDLEPGREGGTWLAMAAQKKKFKIGALLNLTGEPKPRNAVEHNNNILPGNNGSNSQSSNSIPSTKRIYNSTATNHNNLLLGRGMIVSDYVSSHDRKFDSENYTRRLLRDCEKYSAFNFVSIEIGKEIKDPALINLVSNSPKSLQTFEEGKCYGFGNSLPSAPFEKVRVGRDHFEDIVDVYNGASFSPAVLIENLTEFLKDKTKYWPDDELARRAPSWGYGLSSIKVHMPEYAYGSRTHTVILIDCDNKLHFYEETLNDLDPLCEWKTSYYEREQQKD